MAELRKQKVFREKRPSQPALLYDEKKVFSQAKYQSQQSKAERHVTAFEKQAERRRELENKRLMRRISEIHRRKSSLSQSEEEQQRKLYTLNMVSRRWQREKQEQNLQHQNDIIVERIVRMRSYNGSLNRLSPEISKSQQRRKDSNRSLLLPKIDEYEVYE